MFGIQIIFSPMNLADKVTLLKRILLVNMTHIFCIACCTKNIKLFFGHFEKWIRWPFMKIKHKPPKTQYLCICMKNNFIFLIECTIDILFDKI